MAQHSFRNLGVETKVTPRADVEAAFSKIIPAHLRRARDAWDSEYGAVECKERPWRETRALMAPTCIGTVEAAHTGGVERRSVVFADESPSLGCHLVEVREYEAEGLLGDSIGVASLSAGMARSYQDAIRGRLLSIGISLPLLTLRHDPNQVWADIEATQVFQKPSRVFSGDDRDIDCIAIPPRDPSSVRFVCISDTHGWHEKLSCPLPDGDVLLHAGDFSNCGKLAEVERFGRWLASQPFQRKIVIAGNHELTFDDDCNRRTGANPAEVRSAFFAAAGPSTTYLKDETVEVCGVRVYGTPWQPEFCDWAFNVARGPPMARKWAAIPAETDVLLVHGPPLGRGDKCRDGLHTGCADLLAALQQRVRPQFCISGHIHEARGVSFDGVTHYVNAASHVPGGHAPFVFDVPARGGPISPAADVD